MIIVKTKEDFIKKWGHIQGPIKNSLTKEEMELICMEPQETKVLDIKTSKILLEYEENKEENNN